MDKSMARKVISINLEKGILKAQDLMTQHRICNLPDIDVDSKMIGIVTDRDIQNVVSSKWYLDQLSPYKD